MTDVDVDVARGLAAVAAGFAGLHIVDVSNPLAPALVATVPLVDGASRVEVLDGLAIVASGDNLVSIDLASHEVRQTLSLGSNSITDLATEGAMIYTMDTGLNLRAVILDGLVMTPRGSVTLQDAGGKLFVTDGVVYAAAVSPPRDSNFGGSGFSTVDVSDPDHLLVLSDSDANRHPGAGQDRDRRQRLGPGGPRGRAERGLTEETRQDELDVMSVADLTNTAALFTRLPLPALPRSVALASGFAFVADDISDLQVVAIVPLDTADTAPTASIAATPADGDPGSPGIQVLEGHSFALTTRVADDVQVRSVELLVDGQVVDADVAAPWSFFVTPPRVSIAGRRAHGPGPRHRHRRQHRALQSPHVRRRGGFDAAGAARHDPGPRPADRPRARDRAHLRRRARSRATRPVGILPGEPRRRPGGRHGRRYRPWPWPRCRCTTRGGSSRSCRRASWPRAFTC